MSIAGSGPGVGGAAVSPDAPSSPHAPSSSAYFTTVIESGQLATYLQKAYSSGEEAGLSDTLQGYSADKGREIEDLCDKNYRLFLDAVQELLLVRQESRALRERVATLQDGVAAAGAELRDAVAGLNRLRRAKRNVEEARAALLACMDTLRMCKRVQDYLDASKYAAALRLLDELEAGLTGTVMAVDYGQYVAQRVPLLRDRIKREAGHQLSAWLLLAREAASRVGRAALVRASEKPEPELMQGLEGWTPGRGAQSYRELVEGAGRCQLATPHRCRFICEKLGALDDFNRLYCDARRTQARAGWEDSVLLDALCCALGFFVIEDAVGLQLLDEAALHQLWDTALVALSASMAAQLPTLNSDAQDRFARHVALAVQVARQLYLPLERLQQLSHQLGRSYLAARGNETRQRLLETLLEAQHAAPMVVTDAAEWKRLIVMHKLNRPIAPPDAPPLKWETARGVALPFSMGVPAAMALLQEHALHVQSWLVSLGTGEADVEQAVSDSVAQVLSATCRELVRSGGVGNAESASIGGLVQLLVDVQHIVAAVARWGASAGAEPLARASLHVHLADTPQRELISSAMSTFLQLLTAKLRLLTGTLATGDALPSTLLADMGPYLDAVLPSGAHLPETLLTPLRRCAMRAQCAALKSAFGQTLLTPKHVRLLAGDTQSLRMWAETLGISDEPCLMQLEQLCEVLAAGERMRELMVEDRVRQRWSLLSPLHRDAADAAKKPDTPDDWRHWIMPAAELSAWLARVRDEGTSFFGGAKANPHAEATVKALKQWL